MLCEDTTPKKTAYNAYKKTVWLRSRAEGTKMYALKDAYKVHTECIQAYKKSKREDSSFYFFFILPVLPSSTARDLQTIKLSLFASSGNPRQTVNDSFTACFADSGLFWAFIARLTGRPPSSRQFSCFYDHCAFCGHVRIFPSASSLGWTIEKLYALYASKNRLCMLCENITPELTAYNAYRNANRRVRRAERL